MTRETKAQRLEREQAKRAAYEAEMAATYPQRLMAMLERATAENYELEVRNGKFQLVDRDDRDNNFELALNVGEFDDRSENELGLLEWVVEFKESERREADRKYMLKQRALGKLSKEEREVLGL